MARRRSRRNVPVFVEEEDWLNEGRDAADQTDSSPDSGLFEQTPEKDRTRTPKRKRSQSRIRSPITQSAASLSPDPESISSPDSELQEHEKSAYDLYDDTVLPPTQKQHQLKTPKRQRRTSITPSVTQSVDRNVTGRRVRSGRKKPLFRLKENQGHGAGEVSLWDLAIAKNKEFAKWIADREQLDQKLEDAELSVTYDDTFPDRMNTTI